MVAPNLDAYAEFTMKRLLKMPAVKDIRSSFVLETIKDATALPAGLSGVRGLGLAPALALHLAARRLSRPEGRRTPRPASSPLGKTTAKRSVEASVRRNEF